VKKYLDNIPFEKVLIGISFLFVVLLVFYRIQDWDFFWHIANGKAMIEQGRIINEEIFSYTRAGVRFSNHEWLSQILFYLIFKNGGPLAVVLFKCAVTALIAFFIFKTARFAGAGISPSALLMVVAILAGVMRYRERPEMFSLLFISLLGFILYGFRAGRLGGRYVFVIPAVMVLWDFLHGALYGLIFLSAFVIGETVKSTFAKSPGENASSTSFRGEPGYVRTLLIVYVASLAAMVINPYGIRSYGIFVEFLRSHRMILSTNEFTPPDFANFPLFWLLFAVVAGLSLFFIRKADLTHLFVLVPFAVLALKYNRVTVVFDLISVPVLGYYVSLMKERVKHAFSVAFGRAACFAALSAALVYILLLKFFFADGPCTFGYKVNDLLLPVGVTRFIEQSGLKGNMYNPGHFGGYLAYYLYPKRRIFLYNHHVVFGDFPSVVKNRHLLEDYNVQYAILERYWGNSQSYGAVFTPGLWVPVFWDNAAVIVVKNVPENYSFLREHRLRFFLPNISEQAMMQYESNPAILPVFIKEIAGCISFYSNSVMADYLGFLIVKPMNGIPPKEGIPLVEAALRYNNRSAYLWSADGLLHFDEGDYREAERLLTRAVSLDRTLPASWLTLSKIAFSQKRYSLAETYLENVLELDKDYPEAVYGLAVAQLNLGKVDSAVRQLNHFLALVREGPQAEQAREILQRIQPGSGKH
jgi:tetratricopeptide (TPR) repeat protein